ncbi:MAG TPA: serine hydrolase domain-containing protein [Terracidiphilus sp.]|jgi:CubicO group peptidase (beta-lactamase class C family)
MRKLRSLFLPAVPVAALIFTAASFATQIPAPAAQPLVPVAAPPVHSQAAAATPAAPEETHALTHADVGAFFDGIFPLQLDRSDIAGTSVLVMQDGQVLFEKGYGFSDVKNKRPVDPNNTIFRLASISKLFTWVSIMQLQEQGKIDLDADVNRYLDFQIRPAFNRPVTLRNLMTHTGGFEETVDDVIVLDPKQQPALRDYLIANQPRRLFPPGEVPAYSNYGVGLASYVVQRVSGERFEQYVQNHIFTPLGMKHSSFYQPIQKDLQGLVSEGYRGDSTKPAVGFEMLNPVGAGGLSSTAADMGRFGQALLNGGALDGRRILKDQTLAEMWTPQFQASKQLPPICMGFYQDWRNNLRWIGHEGDLIAFHSLFFVEPAQKIVLFVSYNSAGGGGKPRSELIDAFTDRYFPGAPSVDALKNPPAGFRDIEGSYQATRRADSTKLRLSNLGSQATASVDKDGVLTMSNFHDLRGHSEKYKLVAPDTWQSDDQNRIFAIRDSRRRVVRIAFNFPGEQFESVPWYADEDWILPCLFGSYGILALVVVAGLVRLGRRLIFRKRPRWEPQPGTIRVTFAPRAAAFLWILSSGVLVLFFAIKGDDLLPPTPAWFGWFSGMNFVTGLCLLFSLLAVIRGAVVWFHSELRWITKVKFTFVGLSCFFLSWAALFYHLIGPAHRI